MAGLQSSTVARVARPAASEAASVLVLLLVYNVGRIVANGRNHVADGHAWDLVRLQRALRMPDEVSMQALVLDVPHLVELANRYYLLHFPVTIGVLVYLYARHRDAYRWAKRGLVLATGAAMAIHLLLPVTPPRLLEGLGAVDTGTRAGTSVYGGSPVGALTNEYAAMPSLHVGWALLLAIVLTATLSGPWRWLWLLHPLLTLVTVVVTGNHYLLDAAAGAWLVLVGLALARGPSPGRGAPCAEQPVRVGG